MSLETDVSAEPELIQRITAVAQRSSCPLFCDLIWPSDPPCGEWAELTAVMFESARRVVVLQRSGEELRYYAGGWCPENALVHQERTEAEGYEAGVIKTVAEALILAEQYLVEERAFGAIEVPRDVRYSQV